MEMAETPVWVRRCTRTKPNENVFVGDDAEEVFLRGRWDYCMGSVGKRGRGCSKQPGIKTATKCKHLHAHLPLNSESDQISQPFIFTLMTTFTNSFQRAEYGQTRSSDLTVVVIYFIRLFYVSN